MLVGALIFAGGRGLGVHVVRQQTQALVSFAGGGPALVVDGRCGHTSPKNCLPLPSLTCTEGYNTAIFQKSANS